MFALGAVAPFGLATRRGDALPCTIDVRKLSHSSVGGRGGWGGYFKGRGGGRVGDLLREGMEMGRGDLILLVQWHSIKWG